MFPPCIQAPLRIKRSIFFIFLLIAVLCTILSHLYINKEDFAIDIRKMRKQIDTDERRGESFHSSVKSAVPLDTDCANEISQMHHKLLSLGDDPVNNSDPSG